MWLKMCSKKPFLCLQSKQTTFFNVYTWDRVETQPTYTIVTFFFVSLTFFVRVCQSVLLKCSTRKEHRDLKDFRFLIHFIKKIEILSN